MCLGLFCVRTKFLFSGHVAFLLPQREKSDERTMLNMWRVRKLRSSIYHNDNQILAAINVDRHLTTWKIAKRFNIAHSTVAQQLKSIEYVEKLNVPPHRKEYYQLQKELIGGFPQTANHRRPKWMKLSWCGPKDSSKSEFASKESNIEYMVGLT